jgi:glycosyltransferase involved in cell wall biosynthesis
MLLYCSFDDHPVEPRDALVSPLSFGRHQLDFAMPANNCGGKLRLRLDPIDSIGAYVLHSLTLLDTADRVVLDSSVEAGIAKPIAYADADPRLDLQLPGDVIGRGAVLRVDIELLTVSQLCDELERLAESSERSHLEHELAFGSMQQTLQAEVVAHQQALISVQRAAQAEVDAHKRTKAAMLDAMGAKAEARRQGAAVVRELADIRASVLWRALTRIRSILLRIPSPARRLLRRMMKAGWWAVTFWRIPQRLRFLRQRMGLGAGEARALRYVPGQGTEKARYELGSVGEYAYVPPGKPFDLDRSLAELRNKPLFSLVVPVYNTPPGLLGKLIDSVMAQWYPAWELILINDNSSLASVRDELTGFNDPRIAVKHLTENKRISAATNEGIALATGDFVVFLDHDDELTPDCLYELALCVDSEDPDFIYSDEDKIDAAGRYVEPFFKPDWSPDTLMSTMYTCHVSCVRRMLLNEIGGLRTEYDGCQDWDFVLRVTEKTNRIAHIPRVLYHWRILPESVAADLNAKPYAIDAGKRAREEAMLRRGQVGVMEAVQELPGYFRAVYALQGNPLVSILIPSKNNGPVLRNCIESIFSRTKYQNFEVVIIDNGSTDPSTLDDINEFRLMRQVRVVVHDAPFNYSEINNIAVRHSKGDLLIFLNDDTEIISPGWLERMGGYAQLPHVGAVGAKLLYEGGELVQHVGVVNLQDGPGHAMLRRKIDDPGHFCRALLEFNWLAVTGACLMVERDKFERVGGFDESFPVAYNDIDLCLRIIDAGYYNVVCQDVKLIHYESLSRGQDHLDEAKHARLKAEKGRLYRKHPDYFMRDPFHNPNLASNDIYFGLPQ